MANSLVNSSDELLTRVKFAAAWTSVMFMYAYADLLGFYDRRLIESILEGNMPVFGPITPGLRLGIAVLMSVPSLMIFVSIVAPKSVSRWTNVVAGVLLTLVIVATLVMESPLYYKYFGLLEVVLTIYVVWSAFKWTGPQSAQ